MTLLAKDPNEKLDDDLDANKQDTHLSNYLVDLMEWIRASLVHQHSPTGIQECT